MKKASNHKKVSAFLSSMRRVNLGLANGHKESSEKMRQLTIVMLITELATHYDVAGVDASNRARAKEQIAFVLRESLRIRMMLLKSLVSNRLASKRKDVDVDIRKLLSSANDLCEMAEPVLVKVYDAALS